jgi:hypothetical protein
MANVAGRNVHWQSAAEEPEPSPDLSPDPVADVADFYAFVSPDRPDTVTLIGTFHRNPGANCSPDGEWHDPDRRHRFQRGRRRVGNR